MSSRPATAPVSARARIITGRTNAILSPEPGSPSSFSRPATGGGFFSPVARRPSGRNFADSAPDPVEAATSELEKFSIKQLKTMLHPTISEAEPDSNVAAAPETREPFDYKATETRMYQMGFTEGLAKGRSELPPDPYGGLETTRSARAARKIKKAQEQKALSLRKKNEEHLAKFVAKNADEMWEYVPTLYHTQRDEHHHVKADEWLLQKTKEYCDEAYGGNLSVMLRHFENREVEERLSGSHNMRRTLMPTVRMEVPLSIQKESAEAYADGYNTYRKKYEASIHRIFQQPLNEYMLATNGGHASTENRLTKKSLNPFCEPGNMGRTNLSGWADVNSTAGNLQRPNFLRGSPFAQPHEMF